MTAAAVYKRHDLPLNTTDQLREVDMGDWEDMAWGNMEFSEPEMAWNFSNDPAKWHTGGSEDYANVGKRMTRCITDIAAGRDGESIAVFSHGFAIRIFLCGILGVGSHEISKVPYCDNTAVSLLLFEDGKFTIKYRGDNSHLSEELSTFAHQTWWRAEKEYVRENLRHARFDSSRDSDIETRYRDERGTEPAAGEVFTAFLSDQPVGLLGIDTDRGREDCSGWIDFIYIRPELRRRNFGIQLLGQSVSVFRRLGRASLRSAVPANSPALEFCLKYGFRVLSANDETCLVEKNIKCW